ncbi:MAG: hypothetical protein QM759_09530 [Terricaulis sp.]
MRSLLFVSALALAACGQQPAATSADQTSATATAVAATDTGLPRAAPWFICDGIDTPVVFEVENGGAVARIAEYAKPSGAIANRTEFDLGDGDGAAGHVYFALQRSGQDAGSIRETNSGALETPGAAYTPVITEMKIGDRDVSCRWMPRTRLMGFTGRRSFVVSEDASGDLIYTAYSFSDASKQKPIELADNANTTTFSLEVRGGNEDVKPDHTTYRFTNNGYTYVVTANKDQTGTLAVLHGAQQVQSEPITAFETGNGPT